MRIYHYDKNGLYIRESEARSDPLEKDRFLIPARATTIKPMDHTEGKIRCFKDGWKLKMIKTSAPSQYHAWTDKTGWEISLANQGKLDKDIAKAAVKAAENEQKQGYENLIRELVRKQAVEILIADGKLPVGYV